MVKANPGGHMHTQMHIQQSALVTSMSWSLQMGSTKMKFVWTTY